MALRAWTVALATAASLAGAAVIGSAGGSMGPFVSEPAQDTAGEPNTVMVRGGDPTDPTGSQPCNATSFPGRDTFEVEIAINPDGGFELIAETTLTPEADGTWSGQVVVPADTPPGDYVVTAQCNATGGTGGDTFGEYDPQPYTLVTGAAEAVEEEPTFTG